MSEFSEYSEEDFLDALSESISEGSITEEQADEEIALYKASKVKPEQELQYTGDELAKKQMMESRMPFQSNDPSTPLDVTEYVNRKMVGDEEFDFRSELQPVDQSYNPTTKQEIQQSVTPQEEKAYKSRYDNIGKDFKDMSLKDIVIETFTGKGPVVDFLKGPVSDMFTGKEAETDLVSKAPEHVDMKVPNLKIGGYEIPGTQDINRVLNFGIPQLSVGDAKKMARMTQNSLDEMGPNEDGEYSDFIEKKGTPWIYNQFDKKWYPVKRGMRISDLGNIGATILADIAIYKGAGTASRLSAFKGIYDKFKKLPFLVRAGLAETGVEGVHQVAQKTAGDPISLGDMATSGMTGAMSAVPDTVLKAFKTDPTDAIKNAAAGVDFTELNKLYKENPTVLNEEVRKHGFKDYDPEVGKLEPDFENRLVRYAHKIAEKEDADPAEIQRAFERDPEAAEAFKYFGIEDDMTARQYATKGSESKKIMLDNMKDQFDDEFNANSKNIADKIQNKMKEASSLEGADLSKKISKIQKEMWDTISKEEEEYFDILSKKIPRDMDVSAENLLSGIKKKLDDNTRSMPPVRKDRPFTQVEGMKPKDPMEFLSPMEKRIIVSLIENKYVADGEKTFGQYLTKEGQLPDEVFISRPNYHMLDQIRKDIGANIKKLHFADQTNADYSKMYKAASQDQFGNVKRYEELSGDVGLVDTLKKANQKTVERKTHEEDIKTLFGKMSSDVLDEATGEGIADIKFTDKMQKISKEKAKASFEAMYKATPDSAKEDMVMSTLMGSLGKKGDHLDLKTYYEWWKNIADNKASKDMVMKKLSPKNRKMINMLEEVSGDVWRTSKEAKKSGKDYLAKIVKRNDGVVASIMNALTESTAASLAGAGVGAAIGSVFGPFGAFAGGTGSYAIGLAIMGAMRKNKNIDEKSLMAAHDLFKSKGFKKSLQSPRDSEKARNDFSKSEKVYNFARRMDIATDRREAEKWFNSLFRSRQDEDEQIEPRVKRNNNNTGEK